MQHLLEVYREETSTGILTYSSKIASPKPPVKRKQADNRDKLTRPTESAKDTERVRARRLLKGLSTLYATRDPMLFRTRHRVALLSVAGKLIALANNGADRRLAEADLQAWAAKHVPDATNAELRTALDAALDDEGFRTIPRPSDIGFDLELDKLHWFKAGRPWGIHPANLTTSEVLRIQREQRNIRARPSAKARRAAQGATPREQSLAAQARELGISPQALRKRLLKASIPKKETIRDFCVRHGLAERSVRHHRDQGDLETWLAKKGILDLPLFGSENVSPNNNRNLGSDETGTESGKASVAIGIRRAASKPPRLDQGEELSASRISLKIPTDPVRREHLRRLFDIAANAFHWGANTYSNQSVRRSGVA